MVQAPPPSRQSRRQAGLPPMSFPNPIQDNQIPYQMDNQVPHLTDNQVQQTQRPPALTTQIMSAPPIIRPYQVPNPDGIGHMPTQTGFVPSTSAHSARPLLPNNIVETASLSQYTLPPSLHTDHISMQFNPNRAYDIHNAPTRYHTHGIPPRPPSVSSSSLQSQSIHSDMSMNQLSSLGDPMTSSPTFLKAQINHLLEEKRSSEYNMTQILRQMAQNQRLTAEHMQQSQTQVDTLVNQLRDSQSENRRLMQMIIQKQSTHTAKSADIRDLMDTQSQLSIHTSIPTEINLLDTHQHLQPKPMETTKPPLDPFSAIPNHPDTPLPSTSIPALPTPARAQPDLIPSQEALLQQLISVSQAQTKVLTDKSDSSTTDMRFPKYNGKSKDFDGWYNQILSILSTPKWSAMYDFQEQEVIAEDLAPPHLSQNLYSKLVLCLSDDAEKVMRTKHHLRGQGIRFLQTIKSTFKRVLTSTEIMKLESEFARPHRKHNESINSFAARCIQTRNDLTDHGIIISDARLCHRFIHGLGPIFTDIRTNLKNLPNWNTTDMDSLIIEATDHENTVLAIREHNKLFRKPGKDKAENDQSDNQYQKDIKRKAAITKDIEAGTFDPSTYKSQVNAQNCVYHNTNHATTSCDHIGHLLQSNPQQNYQHGPYPHVNRQRQPAAPVPAHTPAPTPAARQVNIENVQDIDLTDLLVTDEDKDLQELETILKNNIVDNKVNPYGITCRNVTLCDSNSSTTPNLDPNITFVIDSGAYPHMCNTMAAFSEFSERLLPGMKDVVLADGTTTAPIKGIGSMEFWIDKHMYRLHNVIYVPQLSHSLFSIKEHCKWKGCYFHAENNVATIAFPKFITSIKIKEEIYLQVKPIIHEQILRHSPPHEKQIFALAKTVQQILQEPLKPKIEKTVSNQLLKFQLLNSNGQQPTRGSPDSAGLDLYASQSVTLPPRTRAKIPTELAMEIPRGCYGRIAPRSGLSIENGIDIGAGVIDPDYRGEVTPVLINNGTEPFLIHKGDRIAQLILEKYTKTTLQQVANLNETLRGEKGFGSSSESHPTSPSHHIALKLNQLKFNKKITIQLPSFTHFTKGRIKARDDDYEFSPTSEDTKYILKRQQVKQLLNTNKLKFGHHHLITIPDNDTVQIKQPPDSPVQKRTVDIPVTNAPPKSIYTMDQLRKYFGFRNVNSILKELKATTTNFGISTMDTEPVLDIGEAATIDKPRRNTDPLPLPLQPGDVVHADILFGSGTAIGGAKYALFLVDRASRHKYIYPIQNLSEDILPAFIKFFNEIGTTPSIIRTDFDHKLMGTMIERHLNQLKCNLQSAPPDLQNMNGICERNWRSILKMARGWLVSSLLPSNFWWFALKRATEVSNYLPLTINQKLTTPHEIVYKSKPDLRNLLPMFCVSYTSYKSDHSYHTQTVKTILVGRSDKTNAFLFYHPTTKQLITSSRYKLDESLVSGPAFGLSYEGGLYFNKYTESSINTRPPTYPPETSVYIQTKEGIIPAEIVTIPLSGHIYTVQYTDGSLHQHLEKEISATNPLTQPHQNDPPLQIFPPWVKHGAKCTMFFNAMPTPKHGTLLKENNIWKFRPGNRITNKAIAIEDFEAKFHALMNTHQIFRGHPSYRKLQQAKSSLTIGKAFARHISAKGLSSRDVPTLINHKRLKPKDKQIWDSAYSEEYYGLKNLPAWTTLTEAEYKRIKHKCKTVLPTMAISTIKFDEHNKPKRAKYRIVVLGNLDPHAWTKSECYSPVMNLFELRLLTALAIRHKCILKNGDFKQAFVQATLPADETYILRPPHGCPLSSPGTYWMLKRTLYGLKRSPRHWYERAKQLLIDIGFKQCKHAPCIFKGHLLPNKAPIYLGLYVDDFIYFSQDKEVEEHFEKVLKSKTNVDFMGQVTHFLGIRYQWRQTNDDHLHVHLSQEAFSDNLVAQAHLQTLSATTNPSPYRSGCPVDSLPREFITVEEKVKLEAQLRSYVGSLLWLSQATRPDLATITNILAKYQNRPTKRIIESAKYVIKYIKGTKDHGITFSSDSNQFISSALHFPLQDTKPDEIIGITDANWGPQDQSVPHPNSKKIELEKFKTRSISGHIIQFHGPLHWSSRRQRITARSSAESEIYATDECVKDLMHLRNIIQDLGLQGQLLNTKIKIFNDNMACVLWSKNTTTKGIRHIQIRENGVRENAHLVDIQHVQGKWNPADLLSKEDKDIKHFTFFRDKLVPKPFSNVEQ